MTTKLNFGEALEYMKLGESVTREEWRKHRSVKFLRARFPTLHSQETHPYIIYSHRGKVDVPFTPGNEEIFAEDWRIIPYEETV